MSDGWVPSWRDNLAWALACAALRLASDGYRSRLRATIALGLFRASEK